MSVILERLIATDEQVEFENYTRDGIRVFGASAPDKPCNFVDAFEVFVDRFQRKRTGFFGKLLGKKPNNIELSLALGVV
jgi:hypothetical protein